MDNKKLLLVSVSVGLFLVVVIGASILAFAPRKYPHENEYGKVELARQEEAGRTETVFPGSAGAERAGSGRDSFGEYSDLPPPVPPLTAAPQNENAFPRNDYNYDTYINEDYGYPQTQNIQPSQSAQSRASREGRAARDDNGGGVIYVYGDTPPAAPPRGTPQNGASAPVPQESVELTYAQPERNTYAEYPPARAQIPPPAPVQETARVQTPAKTPLPEKKAEKKAETVKPAPTPKKRQSDYWVQAGSFSSKNRADNAKDFLAGKGIVSVVSNTSVNGKTVYRVRVGPYTSQSEANYWLSLIKEIDGMGESMVFKSPAKM